MNENGLKRVYKHPIYPRASRKYSDKGFVNIDNGSMGGELLDLFYNKR